MRTLWGGAFQETIDELVARFGQSIHSDLRFWQEDLIGSVAHARMLGETGILSKEESAQIIKALEKIHEEGPEELPTDVEDIHTAIEMRLAEKIGPLAGKLHTARSRNDQVATDARLYLHNALLLVLDEIKDLQGTLLEEAKKHRRTLMPGFTHQMPAQPITLGFYLLAHFWAMQRNGWRAERLFESANYSPLGAAACAGTSFPIDRHATAEELGFIAPMPNALDATSDRSFVLDALHVCALVMIDLSRLSQDLINWSGPGFGFVRLSDRVTTGSSIMPQKRNPDMAELIRGRTAQAIGNWTTVATLMKGLPMGYDRDTQDDKPPLFASIDLVKDSLEIARRMVEWAEWNVRALAAAAGKGASTATDLADKLASEGMPFRQAHEVVGKFIATGEGEGLSLPSARESVSKRESYGAPGPKAMAVQIREATKTLKKRGFAKPY
ncbi:MAG TPA: argininosuccinate lyase [Fimbriimonadaceae bacterium]|nr:argininosuccinate lyase [Fimbriimonadaceae bacterium]